MYTRERQARPCGGGRGIERWRHAKNADAQNRVPAITTQAVNLSA
jgi:hypothetical protein